MLELRNIQYTAGDFMLKEVSFTVNQGEYFVLLGPSGAGKSVLLELIAGLGYPDRGQIIYDQRDFSEEPAWKRPFGLVFQDLALFPHLNVFENIAYPLKKRGHQKSAIRQKVNELADQLDIGNLIKRRPDTLSGGEQQRVALARTLALDPSLLLLDEPMAAVDVSLQHEVRALLRKINRNGVTILHVTHSFEEALAMAHRVAILEKGALIHTGTPREVFDRPRSSFVAHLSGRRNFFKVSVTSLPGSDLLQAEVAQNQSIFGYGDPSITHGFALIDQEDIILSLEKPELSTRNNFCGVITDLHPIGHGMEITVDAGILLHARLTSESAQQMKLEQGVKIWACFKASAVTIID